MAGAPSPAAGGARERTEVVIRNDPRERARVGAAVDALVARHDVPTDAAIDVAIALDEILSNVIAHAYADTAEHSIRVRLSIADGAFEVEVDDDGVAFDPLSVPAPDVDAPLDERALGGLGIHLVRRLMSSVRYRREAGRNVLTVVRRYP